MKKYNLILFLVAILVVDTSGWAQSKGFRILKDSSAFIKKFNEKSKTILTNEADFVQEKYISVMTDKAVSKGKFYYKRPDLMRWETMEPQSHVIVLNKGKMLIREKGKVKTYDATSNKMFKGLNDMMLTTASGNMLQSKEYKYKLFENDKYFQVQLFPNAGSTKKFVRVIEILIEKSDYTVSQIRMVEPSEDYTSISFSNKKINATITDDTFILK